MGDAAASGFALSAITSVCVVGDGWLGGGALLMVFGVIKGLMMGLGVGLIMGLTRSGIGGVGSAEAAGGSGMLINDTVSTSGSLTGSSSNFWIATSNMACNAIEQITAQIIVLACVEEGGLTAIFKDKKPD
jgi:hypothetical protein